MANSCIVCKEREAVARGRCHRCYTRQSRSGEIVRRTYRGEDLMQELQLLGFNPDRELNPQYQALAPRLGMTVPALAKAHRRHRELLK